MVKYEQIIKTLEENEMEEIRSFIGKAILVILLVFLMLYVISIISNLFYSVTCNECGTEITSKEKHCSKCGNALIPSCSYCGNEEGHNQETKFCVECGTRIE